MVSSREVLSLSLPRSLVTVPNTGLFVTGGDVLPFSDEANWAEDLDVAAAVGEVAGELAAARAQQDPPVRISEAPQKAKTDRHRLRVSEAVYGGPAVGHLTEPPAALPVIAAAGVAVAGDGLPATAAAIAAATSGVETILIGHHGFLGGRATAEGVNMFMHQAHLGGIYERLMRALLDMKARLPGQFACDPELMKLLLADRARQAGVHLRLYERPTGVLLKGNQVCGIVADGPAGRLAIRADVVVDATRNGDLAAAAGTQYTVGREVDGLTQPATLMFVLKATGPRGGPVHDFRFGYPMPGGRVVVNATRVRTNGLDPASLTHAEIVGRQQMFAKLYGLQDRYDYRLLHSGPEVFVRETRHIAGEYTLRLEDLLAGRLFSDTIATCDYPIDIHNPTGGPGGRLQRVPMYAIPYRCLLPRGVEGLLVTGRAISATHEAFGSCRIMATCLALGEAAGVAAALSVQDHVHPRNLSTNAIQAELSRRGVQPPSEE